MLVSSDCLGKIESPRLEMETERNQLTILSDIRQLFLPFSNKKRSAVLLKTHVHLCLTAKIND